VPVEDGEASAEAWKDSNGIAMAPDRFWNTGIESDIAGDDEGPCMGIELNIWERMKVCKLLYVFRHYAYYMHYLPYIYYSEMFPQVQLRRHIVHTMVGGRGQHGGYATLDYRKIHQGNAGKLGNYPILSVLPDKFARFLFEYHSHCFESLDLLQLPADRSDFDVHGALLDDKVQTNCNTLHFAQSYPLLCLNNFLYVL
jgi:hypothetical protein